MSACGRLQSLMPQPRPAVRRCPAHCSRQGAGRVAERGPGGGRWAVAAVARGSAGGGRGHRHGAARVLETPGATAALVTPDRDLAGRVAADLLRYGVVADDSAGEPLSDTPPAVFLRLLAHAVAEELAPVPLLALLKHPLAAAGLAPAACRAAARAMELACLRGPRPRRRSGRPAPRARPRPRGVRRKSLVGAAGSLPRTGASDRPAGGGSTVGGPRRH